MLDANSNRRRFERLSLPVAYTSVRVSLLNANAPLLDGHAYDLSEGGCQFELDRAIAPGTAIMMQIELPVSISNEEQADSSAVLVIGNVVWLDESEPGPARMAIAFTRFAQPSDRERLTARLSTALSRRAA
jgi:c-di-GMP-binding flagellar brake protein YcgR